MISCQEETFELEDLNGTWNMDWKRCDLYHTQPEGKLEFWVNDSVTDLGKITERIGDTLVGAEFRFEWINNEALFLDSLSDSSYLMHWMGYHEISELTTGRFELKRDATDCERELYKFVK